MQQAELAHEPVLTQFDAWGNRIDQVAVSPLWREAERLAAQHGLVATAYEPALGRHARIAQFLKVYLLHPSTRRLLVPAGDDRRCRALPARASGDPALIERALPHLTSRDPAVFWTSGQWMTETTGGSDVGPLRDARACRTATAAGACTAASGSPRRSPRR